MFNYSVVKGRLVEWDFTPAASMQEIGRQGEEGFHTRIMIRVNNRGNIEEVWFSGRDIGLYKLQIFVDGVRVYAKRIRSLSHFKTALKKADIKRE